MKPFKTVTFKYNKEMLPYFEEGRKQFWKETRIILTGISWKVEDEDLIVTVTQEQQEQWLFHLAFCIGVTYAKMEGKAS
jgi:hypothetical protein